jgi:hypothetical protein
MVAPSAAACCALCVANTKQGCVQWAWHTAAKGKFGKDTCHLCGANSKQKRQAGTISGVLNASTAPFSTPAAAIGA